SYLLAWRDSRTLHQHMLAHNENSAMLMDLLAMDLIVEGKKSEAMDLETQAVAANPDYPIAHLNLGNMLLGDNKIDDAMKQYQQAAVANPDYGMAHSMIGRIYALQGKIDDAISESRRGVELEPSIAELHY